MKSRYLSWPIALPTLAFCASVAAQTPVPVQLPPSVVTATRSEQPIVDVVADISVIERAEIERLGVTSLMQLLGTLSGVQTIGYGDSPKVYLRGADARMTALYVDGVRVDSQDGLRLGGGAPWELIPIAQVERVEVLRGPASAIYGSDAMGGVVQIFTRRGTGALRPYVQLGVGSQQTRVLSAGLSGRQQGWDLALSAGLQDTDGYDTRPDLTHTPQRESSNSRHASVRLGYALSSTQRLEVRALSQALDAPYVPWNGGTDYQSHANLSSSALQWSSQWSEGHSSRLTLSRSTVAKRDDVPYDFQTGLRSALLEGRWRVGAADMTVALERKEDSFDSLPSGYYDPAFRGTRSQDALALGYAGRYGVHALQLQARWDHDAQFGTHGTGLLGYAWHLAPHWRASLSAGSAFRAPTLEQIFGPYGDAQLLSETSLSREAALSWADAGHSVKAVVYRSTLRNMISSSAALTSCSAGYFCYYNVGRASLGGVSLSGATQIGPYGVHTALDWLDPRDDVTGHTLSLRARRTLSLGVQRPWQSGHVGLDLQAVGERFDNAANTVRLGGYALVHLHASHRLSPDWQWVLRGNNLGDVRYTEVSPYATPGRTWYLGLQWQPKT